MNVAENETIKRLEKLRRAADTVKEPQSISVKALRRLGVLIKETLDLINRTQAALEKSLNALCKKEDLMQLLAMERQQYYDELQKAKAIIGELRHLYEQAKAEAAEVKHGEWIKQKPDPEAIKKWHELGIAKGWSENSIFWTCSCCKGWGTPAHKYCSQCGAKMDAQKEGAANV